MSAWYDDEGPKGYTDWPTAAATGEDGGMGIGDGNGGKASL